MNCKIIVLLILIAMIILFATSCTEKTQTEDSTQMQEELQSSAEEQIEVMDPEIDLNEDQEQNATSQGKLSKQENDELLNDTLNTLNDLEETIDSLEDVTDSDLQIPE